METAKIVDFARRDGLTDSLRTGTPQLIAKAVVAEFPIYLTQFAD